MCYVKATLCLLGAWATLTGGVIVQDGDFSFSLESVKKLKDLQELQEPRIPRNPVGPITSNLCSLPTFPEELKPLCKEPNAQEILDRLGAIAAADAKEAVQGSHLHAVNLLPED